jgi:hypothetical protein
MQGGQTQEFNICHAPRPPDTDPMAVKEVNRILINEEDNEEGFSQEDTIMEEQEGHSAS